MIVWTSICSSCSHLMNLYSFALLVPVFAVWYYWRTNKTFPVNNNGILLITGASSGIGYYLAEKLAKDHSYVVYATVRKHEDIEKLNALNLKNLHPLILDVTDHKSCSNALKVIENHMESEKLPLVAVIQNAAINKPSPAEYFPLEDAKKIFDTNFFGVVDLTQLFLPLLRRSQGRMIMMSSIVASQPVPSASIYSASKTALEGFTTSLRREVEPYNVAVISIQPGYVLSEMNPKNQVYLEDLLTNSSRSEDLRLFYSHLYNDQNLARYKRFQSKADSPSTVLKATLHAVKSPFPKAHYYVANIDGIPCYVISWLNMLGDRVQDWIMTKI